LKEEIEMSNELEKVFSRAIGASRRQKAATAGPIYESATARLAEIRQAMMYALIYASPFLRDDDETKLLAKILGDYAELYVLGIRIKRAMEDPHTSELDRRHCRRFLEDVSEMARPFQPLIDKLTLLLAKMGQYFSVERELVDLLEDKVFELSMQLTVVEVETGLRTGAG
jgi:hypothetical protein